MEKLIYDNAMAQLRIARMNLDQFNAWPETKAEQDMNAYAISQALEALISGIAGFTVGQEIDQAEPEPKGDQ